MLNCGGDTDCLLGNLGVFYPDKICGKRQCQSIVLFQFFSYEKGLYLYLKHVVLPLILLAQLHHDTVLNAGIFTKLKTIIKCCKQTDEKNSCFNCTLFKPVVYTNSYKSILVEQPKMSPKFVSLISSWNYEASVTDK